MVRFILAIILLVGALAARVVKRHYTKRIEAGANDAPVPQTRRDPYGPSRPATLAAMREYRTVATVVMGVCLAGAVVFGFFSTFRIVGANEVAIPVTFGKVGDVKGNGPTLVWPWTDLRKFSTKQEESRMVAKEQEGENQYDDSIVVNSKENGQMFADVIVRYRIDPDEDRVLDLYRYLGNNTSPARIRDKIVRPQTQQVARDVFAFYAATDARTTARIEIAAKVREQLSARLGAQGIFLVDLNVGNLAFDAPLQAQVNAKLEAQQNAEKAIIEQARRTTDAETLRLEAEKAAESERLRAAGVADANALIAASITSELIELRKTEALREANTIYVPIGSDLLIGAAPAAVTSTTTAPATGG